MKGRKSQTVT